MNKTSWRIFNFSSIEDYKFALYERPWRVADHNLVVLRQIPHFLSMLPRLTELRFGSHFISMLPLLTELRFGFAFHVFPLNYVTISLYGGLEAILELYIC